jgi:Flp pilus assembly protein TadD
LSLRRSSEGAGAARRLFGCAAAAYNLGVLYYNRGEKGKAEKFFSEAKKNGYDLK